MRIYADVVFAVNLAMDIFILWIVGKLRRKHIPPLRLFTAGFIMAALYCALMFVGPLREYMNIFAAIFIASLGVVICFRPQDIVEFATLTGLMHISAFALGGVGMALFYFTNIGDALGDMLVISVQNFSVKLLIAATCSFYIFIRLFAIWFQNVALKKQAFYPVKISYRENDVSLTALVDTGNQLRDPISRAPVIVAEFNAVKNFLPDCMKLVFYEKKENDMNSWINDINDSAFAGRLRMIPFASLGRENGMLLGFRPDKVEIVGVDVFSDVIIGIYNFDLSNGGKYQGLLGPELIR